MLPPVAEPQASHLRLLKAEDLNAKLNFEILSLPFSAIAFWNKKPNAIKIIIFFMIKILKIVYQSETDDRLVFSKKR